MLIAARNGMITGETMFWGLCFTAEEDGASVSMSSTGTPPAVTLETSFDGKNWDSFSPDGDTSVTLVNAGDKVYFRAGPGGNTRFATSDSNYRSFQITGRVAASGNIMSLLDAYDPDNTTLTGEWAFFRLFSGCATLTAAPELPATTLSYRCYSGMLEKCSILTAAPELPATALAPYCYAGMFNYDYALTNVPAVLPATVLKQNCYQSMFGRCAFSVAPELPATTLAQNCYQYMFNECRALTTAPVLPATTLAYGCYEEMFGRCSALTTAPELPATTLYIRCYYGMFAGCTSLIAAPELPATRTTERCYRAMFEGCTSLLAAPELPAAAPLGYECYYAMFNGCTSLASAPAILPATDLNTSCYAAMFRGTALTTAPVLPATNPSSYAYWNMFQNCRALSSVEVAFTSFSSGSSTPGWLSNVAASGVLKCPTALGTDETIKRGTSYCPTGWTVVNIDATASNDGI